MQVSTLVEDYQRILKIKEDEIINLNKQIQALAYDVNHYKQKCWKYENKSKDEEE